MFGDLTNKLQEMQKNVEASKERLNHVTVTGEADGVVISMNGNRRVTDIQIAKYLLEDKERLQDTLVVACNRAIDNASRVHDAEMANSASQILPDFQGFGR